MEKKNSFVFYSSFAQAAATLGDKARLKLYDAIVKLGLTCVENVSDLEQVCAEIESNLAQNRNVFAQFLLIKPQILSNFKKYINGKKGKDFGHLGGAPLGNKNARKNNGKTTPNENVNVNVYNTPPIAPPPVDNFSSSVDKSGALDKVGLGLDKKKMVYVGDDYHIAWDVQFQEDMRGLTETQIGEIDSWVHRMFPFKEIPVHVIRNALLTRSKREIKGDW